MRPAIVFRRVDVFKEELGAFKVPQFIKFDKARWNSIKERSHLSLTAFDQTANDRFTLAGIDRAERLKRSISTDRHDGVIIVGYAHKQREQL